VSLISTIFSPALRRLAAIGHALVRMVFSLALKEAKGSDPLIFPSHLLENGGDATEVIA
jgi:hypothetical protein